jgi:hypothetical protein
MSIDSRDMMRFGRIGYTITRLTSRARELWLLNEWQVTFRTVEKKFYFITANTISGTRRVAVSSDLRNIHLKLSDYESMNYWCGQIHYKKVGGGWALEIEAFLGPKKWHQFYCALNPIQTVIFWNPVSDIHWHTWKKLSFNQLYYNCKLTVPERFVLWSQAYTGCLGSAAW